MDFNQRGIRIHISDCLIKNSSDLMKSISKAFNKGNIELFINDCLIGDYSPEREEKEKEKALSQIKKIASASRPSKIKEYTEISDTELIDTEFSGTKENITTKEEPDKVRFNSDNKKKKYYDIFSLEKNIFIEAKKDLERE